MHSVSGIQTHDLSDRAAAGTGYVVYRYSLHVVFLRQLIRLVIRNRCDTSWHKVFIKNCYLNISTYTALYLLPICHIKLLNLKSLFVQIYTFHMHAVRYEVYHHPPFLLRGLHSIRCKCKCIKKTFLFSSNPFG
jgi:hypothetical protein